MATSLTWEVLKASMMATAGLDQESVTLEQLIGSSLEGRFELHDGKLERVHMSPFTSRVAVGLSSMLQLYCKEKGTGVVYESEVYYRCFENPKTSRKPDITVVLTHHLPKNADEVGFFEFVPDLVVEVISPGDRALRVERKIREYRKADVPLLWVIYPQYRFAKVWRAGQYEEIEEDGFLDGRDVLPGFQMRLGELFPLPGT